MEDNKVAIETGLRAELVGDFIDGLKNLFSEHYIEIPEEKVDVAEELAVEVASMQEAAAEKDAKIAALTEEINVAKKEKLVRLACEGLTEVQAGKMKSLAESVEFTTEGEFNDKLAIIRENYFPTKTNVKSEVKAIQETAVEEPEEVAEVHGIMAHYVKALSKTAPKA
jgi:phage host-nuclease inhibitor protein Gam